MSNLIQDLRFAIRSFIRAPRFTMPALLALALGIGAMLRANGRYAQLFELQAAGYR